MEPSAALPQFACFCVGLKRTKAKGMGRLEGSGHDAVRFYHLRGALREDGPGGSSPPFDQQEPTGLRRIYFLAITTGTVSIWPFLANSSRSALVSGL